MVMRGARRIRNNLTADRRRIHHLVQPCPNYHEDQTETKHLEIEELNAAAGRVVLRPQSRRQRGEPILRRFFRRVVVALERSRRLDPQ
jgi:hypothetical protein